MAKYARTVSKGKATPQSRKAKAGQVKNRAGGFVFKVDDWTRLSRFLILGNDGGTYYAKEGELTFENYECVLRCLSTDWKRTIDHIVEVSDEGRGVKNAPAVFALAVASVKGVDAARAYANKVMPKVARYSSDFFTFVADVMQLKDGKFAKGLQRAIGRWYTEKDAVRLAYQLCKYPQRSIGGDKWSHADLLRLAHISRPAGDKKVAKGGRALTCPSDDHAFLFDYAVHGVTDKATVDKRKAEAESTGREQKATGVTPQKITALRDSKLKYVYAHERAKKATKTSEIVKLIEDFRITRESIPPQFRNEVEVQRALLGGMPMTALIRNIGSMTASGLLKPLSKETSMVAEKITDRENLKGGRIHPMTVLMALKVYAQGRGIRTSWTAVPALKDALEDAFYASFEYVEPTGKKYLLGVDCSGSMGCHGWGSQPHAVLTPREAAGAVAMTIARSEKNYQVMGFCSTFRDLNVRKNDSLESVCTKINRSDWGGTDCSLPMQYAMKHGLDVDCFVVLTDNETWAGNIHPFEALKRYRKEFNKEAKLAVLGFTATDISIADPSDAGMMDFVGLDSNVPKILAGFAKGDL